VDEYNRARCGVGGFLLSAAAAGWLCFFFNIPRMAGLDALGVIANPYAPFRYYVLFGVAVLHPGLFLCVKAACNPSLFWRHTGRHLALASALAWAITVALFVAFAVIP
jgi:hypothetical protein